jgi:hypothetical protein
MKMSTGLIKPLFAVPMVLILIMTAATSQAADGSPSLLAALATDTADIAPIDATAGFGLGDRTLLAAVENDQPAQSIEPGDIEIDPAPTPAATDPADPYAKGSMLYQAYGAAIFGHDAGEIYLGHVGFAYYFIDKHAILFELVAGDFDGQTFRGQEGGDGFVWGANLLIRWNFYNADPVSAYLDFGAGILFFNEPYAASGTHSNFSPQGGLGISVRLDNRCRLMAGARWHHVSNAFRKGEDQNPGTNAAMLYLGLMWGY